MSHFLRFVAYESADKLAEDAKEDKWDVAMIGADPARAEFIDFTPPYCQIEATYAVPTTSGLRTCAEVDKEGVRIAGCDGAAYAARSTEAWRKQLRSEEFRRLFSLFL